MKANRIYNPWRWMRLRRAAHEAALRHDWAEVRRLSTVLRDRQLREVASLARIAQLLRGE